MSFGSDFQAMYRRAADYVDKILRGTKPGDIQIEQPTKFDLALNLNTAKTISLFRAIARNRRRGDRMTILWPQRRSPVLALSGHSANALSGNDNFLQVTIDMGNVRNCR